MTTTIGVRKYQPGVKDERGNVIDSWAAPVDVPVRAVAPGGQTDEPGYPARDLSMIAWTVYAFTGHGVEARDLVVLNGHEYQVNGEPRDWTMGPVRRRNARRPGAVIELLRAEG